MRILHIPSTYAPVIGGTELLCQKVSETLARQGHQVRVLTGNVSAVDGYYHFGVTQLQLVEEVLNEVEIKRIPYGGILYKLGIPGVWKLLWRPVRDRIYSHLMALIQKQFINRIYSEIESFQPDVVMTMPHLVNNVKFVLQVHQNQPFPLVMVPLLHEESPNWPTQEMKIALRQTDAVLASTDHEAQRLERIYQVPNERLFTAYLGIDLPPVSSPEVRSPKVLFLGRKVPSKGLPDLLAAMRLVWNILPDTELIMAGARMPQTQEIDRLIEALPENERLQIRSLDNVSEQEKSKLLNTSACLVLPSRSESFGLVLLEAWAHQLPVVTLNLPVFRSIVSPNVDGLLTEAGDIVALSNAILFMLQNPETARTMGQAGRVKVEQRFTWDKTAASYFQAYEYAVANGKRRGETIALGREILT